MYNGYAAVLVLCQANIVPDQVADPMDFARHDSQLVIVRKL